MDVDLFLRQMRSEVFSMWSMVHKLFQRAAERRLGADATEGDLTRFEFRQVLLEAGLNLNHRQASTLMNWINPQPEGRISLNLLWRRLSAPEYEFDFGQPGAFTAPRSTLSANSAGSSEANSFRDFFAPSAEYIAETASLRRPRSPFQAALQQRGHTPPRSRGTTPPRTRGLTPPRLRPHEEAPEQPIPLPVPGRSTTPPYSPGTPSSSHTLPQCQDWNKERTSETSFLDRVSLSSASLRPALRPAPRGNAPGRARSSPWLPRGHPPYSHGLQRAADKARETHQRSIASTVPPTQPQIEWNHHLSLEAAPTDTRLADPVTQDRPPQSFSAAPPMPARPSPSSTAPAPSDAFHAPHLPAAASKHHTLAQDTDRHRPSNSGEASEERSNSGSGDTRGALPGPSEPFSKAEATANDSVPQGPSQGARHPSSSPALAPFRASAMCHDLPTPAAAPTPEAACIPVHATLRKVDAHPLSPPSVADEMLPGLEPLPDTSQYRQQHLSAFHRSKPCMCGSMRRPPHLIAEVQCAGPAPSPKLRLWLPPLHNSSWLPCCLKIGFVMFEQVLEVSWDRHQVVRYLKEGTMGYNLYC
ncbi:hypothetical protein CYMTET_27404 [Cymbomonas tetramitiformis]|uniref:Uncharacterized protein n=1 Tax=Cymbomonas tetramitiformis TaxID=36881 RepID=A0AAE0FPV0_9CHLO|nr:hypothetical protein CYMTET_27404 [Cymbomonas tetramitiformis]